MNNLILILILSASQPVLIDVVAILPPKGIEIPKGRCIEKPSKKSWYAKYF